MLFRSVFIDAVFDLLKLVTRRGYIPIIVSNQQGVGKGLMTRQQLDDLTVFFQDELRRRCGVAFADVLYCTELESAQSLRRKPAPGMLFEAAAAADIVLAESWMIGDSISDVQAGRAAGTRTILVGDYANVFEADLIVPDVASAVPLLEKFLLFQS